MGVGLVTKIKAGNYTGRVLVADYGEISFAISLDADTNSGSITITTPIGVPPVIAEHTGLIANHGDNESLYNGVLRKAVSVVPGSNELSWEFYGIDITELNLLQDKPDEYKVAIVGRLLRSNPKDEKDQFINFSGVIGLLANMNNIAVSQGYMVPEQVSWETFRSVVFDTKNQEYGSEDYIFRGQKDSRHFLDTTFHRQNRYCIQRLHEDFKKVEGVICRYIGRNFDIENEKDYGELMFLAQHYGFPTPLLDWSKSPFVAAYFAFKDLPYVRNLSNNERENSVKIYCLHTGRLEMYQPDVGNSLKNHRFGVYVSEFNQLHNTRAAPQQAISIFSNMQEIEAYFFQLEKKAHREWSEEYKPMIKIFEIKWSERDKVLSDLQKMGITSESMFPGIEGAFEALKHRIYW